MLYVLRCVLLALAILVSGSHVLHAAPDTSEVKCLADNIYYEATDEPYNGKLAVATVTMNRLAASGFPKSICGVVYEHGKRGCQFSWTCGKRAVMNSQLYNQAFAVAKQVLDEGKRLLSIGNATYFHSIRVHPLWAHESDMKRVAQVGSQIFYSLVPSKTYVTKGSPRSNNRRVLDYKAVSDSG